MRKLASAVFGLMLLGLSFPKVADVAPVDWLGRLSAMGGATSESWRRKEGTTLGHAHGIGQFEALGVVPIFGPLGFQAMFNFEGGDGRAYTVTGGPVFDFGMGKFGFFGSWQARTINPCAQCGSGEGRKTHFWWLIPTLSLYDIIPGTNIDLWHSNPINATQAIDGKEDDKQKRLIPYSATRLAINWFPAFIPFIARDNLELTLGVQLNGLAGPGHENAALGVGPVFGAAVMPIVGIPLELTLFKAWIDNHNRYKVTSGIQYSFARGNPTLLQLRRKYMEPTALPGNISTFWQG